MNLAEKLVHLKKGIVQVRYYVGSSCIPAGDFPMGVRQYSDFSFDWGNKRKGVTTMWIKSSAVLHSILTAEVT